MKEKLLQFFTGKMSKTIYISIVSAVVCGAVVITSTVIVHNNNQKIDSVLESLAASESVAELSSENATESIFDTDNTDSDAQAKAPNGEPAGDKALQYLAEYNALTEEYERKRAELEKQVYEVPDRPLIRTNSKPVRVTVQDGVANADALQERYDKVYENELAIWESESESIALVNAKSKSDDASERAQVNVIQKQIDSLDAQYRKDIASLKAKYGIK